MKIFLSYSRPNQEHARRLYDEMRARGYDPWFDKEKLLAGQKWRVEIAKAIKSSDFAVILFSAASINRDGFYQREIRTCLDVLQEKAASKVWLLPVRLDECKVPDEIEDYQYVDLFPEWERGFGRLVASINAQAQEKAAVADQIDVVVADLDITQQEQVPDLRRSVVNALRKAGGISAGRRSGSHEIWTLGDRRIVVPESIRSRLLAYNVLAVAGLQEML